MTKKIHKTPLKKPVNANDQEAWKFSQLGVEFMSAILVGIGLGYILDQWLHTKPWLMLLFLFFGVAAGIQNIMRAIKKM